MMSSLPATYRGWRRTHPPTAIEMTSENTPSVKSLGADDVLLRINAVSLNFRDVAMIHGRYIKPVEDRGFTGSDCAAEVVGTGPEVRNFKVGDRVSIVYDLNNINATDKGEMAALGGEKPGVLREYAIFPQSVIVHIPEHLSWEEGSTLTCAGVTAWTALGLPQSAEKGNAALLQGTGGVSLFALILCLHAGIFPIITPSSDKKLDDIKKLASPGAIGTINYKTQDVVEEALRLTGNLGVDFVVNNVGAAAFHDDIRTLRRRGQVSLVGFLDSEIPPLDSRVITDIIVKCAKVIGIYVGSLKDFQEMNDFITKHRIDLKPLLDTTFNFKEADKAFEYLWTGRHTGKVIIGGFHE